jgi:hypothetical protein
MNDIHGRPYAMRFFQDVYNLALYSTLGLKAYMATPFPNYGNSASNSDLIHDMIK